MKKALTLIELILSIVIIGLVFMVIPKIIFILNRGFSLSMKEEALYTAASMTGEISILPWDQHTIDRDGKILSAGGVECNSTTGPHNEGYYRVGGFVGSRNCIGWQDSNDWRPTDSVDISNGYDDIDDYNGYHERLDGKRVSYDINITVTRDRDIKRATIKITSLNTTKESFSTSFIYESANIGWSKIHSEIW